MKTTYTTHRTGTKILLTIISNIGQATVDYVTIFSHIKQLGWQAVGHDVGDRRALIRLKREAATRAALYNLRRHGYLRAQKIGRRLAVTLTTKGQHALLINQLQRAKPNSAGFTTVVIFDIPEDQRLVRRALRWFLRQGGFRKLQQSVWVHQGDVYKPVAEFVRSAKAQRWVNVFHGRDFMASPK